MKIAVDATSNTPVRTVFVRFRLAGSLSWPTPLAKKAGAAPDKTALAS